MKVSTAGQGWTARVEMSDSKRTGTLILKKQGKKETHTIELKDIKFPTKSEEKVKTVFCKTSAIGHGVCIDVGTLQRAVQKYLEENPEKWETLRDSLEQRGLSFPLMKYVNSAVLNEASSSFATGEPKLAGLLKHEINTKKEEILFALSWGVKKIIPICGEVNKNLVFAVDPETCEVSVRIGGPESRRPPTSHPSGEPQSPLTQQADARAQGTSQRGPLSLPSLWKVKILSVTSELEKSLVFEIRTKEGNLEQIKLDHIIFNPATTTTSAEVDISRIDKRSLRKAVLSVAINSPKVFPKLVEALTQRRLMLEIQKPVARPVLYKAINNCLFEYYSGDLAKCERVFDYVGRVLKQNLEKELCVLSLGGKKEIPLPHELSTTNEVMSIKCNDKGKVIVKIKQQQQQRPQTVPHKMAFATTTTAATTTTTTTTTTAASEPKSSVYSAETDDGTFLMVGNYSIRLTNQEEFNQLCLSERSNELFCGNVTATIDNRHFKVSCREIAETIQKASGGNENVKRSLELTVAQTFGISKNQVNPFFFPANNKKLADALQDVFQTGNPAEAIRYIDQNYSVLMDAIAWAPLGLQSIRVKKQTGLPCSLTFRVVDNNLHIEFVSNKSGEGSSSVVKKVVRYSNNTDGSPCVAILACRRARTKSDERKLYSQQSHQTLQQVVKSSFDMAAKLRDTVPYISREEFFIVPAQGGVKEKVYSELGPWTLEEKILTLGTSDALSQEDYNYFYAVMLCILSAGSGMHKMQHCHFDFKPDNILLLEDDSPSLIDFGSTKCIHENEKLPGNTIRGTSKYQEPQWYTEETSLDMRDGAAIDTFALGATMLNIFCPGILRGRLFLRCQSESDGFSDFQKVCDQTCQDIVDYQKELMMKAKSCSPDKKILYETIAKMISIPREDRPSLEVVFLILLKSAPQEVQQCFKEFERRRLHKK